MALLSDAQLAASIRAGDIKNVYYFYGKDTAAIQSYTSRLVEKLAGKGGDSLNLHRLSGAKLSMSELWDCCNMLPCFADRVVVTVNDLNCDAGGFSKNDFDYILDMVADLPETTTLIFYATGVDLYKNKKYLSDRNEKLNKLCQKIGNSCEFSFKTPEELAKIIGGRLQKNGCSISKKNAVYLAQKCLCETESINSEIAKLSAYAEGREITEDDIDMLCARRLDADTFKLAGFIVRKNADAAFSLLGELYDMQQPTISIIAAMTAGFSDIYRAKAAVSARKGTADIVSDFSYPKNRAFAVERAAGECRYVSEDRIRNCIKALAEADIKVKMSPVDDRIILERCITLMLEK